MPAADERRLRGLQRLDGSGEVSEPELKQAERGMCSSVDTRLLREPQPFFHVRAALVLAPGERVSPRHMPERLAPLGGAAEAGRELQLLGRSSVCGGDS